MTVSDLIKSCTRIQGAYAYAVWFNNMVLLGVAIVGSDLRILIVWNDWKKFLNSCSFKILLDSNFYL